MMGKEIALNVAPLMSIKKQGILETEDGPFFEDEPTHEIVRERYRNISPRKCFGCSGKRHYDFQRERETPYARMRMTTWQSKPCAPSSTLSSFHMRTSSAFVNRNHAPESGRGDDEATGNTQPSRKYFGVCGGHRNEAGMALCRWISSCLQPNFIW